jgi:hypothetical protein
MYPRANRDHILMCSTRRVRSLDCALLRSVVKWCVPISSSRRWGDIDLDNGRFHDQLSVTHARTIPRPFGSARAHPWNGGGNSCVRPNADRAHGGGT